MDDVVPRTADGLVASHHPLLLDEETDGIVIVSHELAAEMRYQRPS